MQRARLHVVTYDISSDDVRTAVATVLTRFGERVQESVFECRLTDTDVQELRLRLGVLLSAEPNSSVRIYRQCARWRACMRYVPTSCPGPGLISPVPAVSCGARSLRHIRNSA
jgi:CRISPR-associated protein Cas2